MRRSDAHKLQPRLFGFVYFFFFQLLRARVVIWENTGDIIKRGLENIFRSRRDEGNNRGGQRRKGFPQFSDVCQIPEVVPGGKRKRLLDFKQIFFKSFQRDSPLTISRKLNEFREIIDIF